MTNWARHFDITTYVEDNVGIARTAVGGKGEEHICDCPFCGKRMKLYVNAETGLFICYSCEESGALPHLIMELEGVSYRHAIDRITRAAGAQLSLSVEAMRKKRRRRQERKEARAVKRRRIRAREREVLPPEYRPIWNAERGTQLRVAYLEETRGFSTATSRRFRLGVCMEGDYAGRVVFPVIEHGRIVTFQARAMGDWEPKYMNPGDVEKGEYVYGLDLVAGDPEPIVVEGPTDVVSCFQKGIRMCAPLGKTMTRRQLRKLRDGGAKRLCVLLDGSATKEAMKVAAVAIEVMEVRVAHLPGELDPDDAPLEVLEEVLEAARPPTTRELRAARDGP